MWFSLMKYYIFLKDNKNITLEIWRDAQFSCGALLVSCRLIEVEFESALCAKLMACRGNLQE